MSIALVTSANLDTDWHTEYTLPTQWDFYTPHRISHGSYWFYGTTEDEVA
jgi:hypothetical protein